MFQSLNRFDTGFSKGCEGTHFSTIFEFQTKNTNFLFLKKSDRRCFEYRIRQDRVSFKLIRPVGRGSNLKKCVNV